MLGDLGNALLAFCSNEELQSRFSRRCRLDRSASTPLTSANSKGSVRVFIACCPVDAQFDVRFLQERLKSYRRRPAGQFERLNEHNSMCIDRRVLTLCAVGLAVAWRAARCCRRGSRTASARARTIHTASSASSARSCSRAVATSTSTASRHGSSCEKNLEHVFGFFFVLKFARCFSPFSGPCSKQFR